MRLRLLDLTVLLLEQLRSRHHVSPLFCDCLCNRSLSWEADGFPHIKHCLALYGTVTFITVCARAVQFFPIHTPHNYLFFNNLEPEINVNHGRLCARTSLHIHRFFVIVNYQPVSVFWGNNYYMSEDQTIYTNRLLFELLSEEFYVYTVETDNIYRGPRVLTALAWRVKVSFNIVLCMPVCRK
jgi:hypothetical protein